MRREGNVCQPDSLVRPAPFPEHPPFSQEPIIEDVIENEHDKEVVTEGQKGETPAEQDTGISTWNSNMQIATLRNVLSNVCKRILIK